MPLVPPRPDSYSRHATPCGPAAPRLDLRNDAVFKLLFAHRVDLLTDLVNAVRHGLPPLRIVEVLNPAIDPEELKGKLIVLDLLGRHTDGTLVNVEMQMRRYASWPERSAYYLARGYSGQIERGEPYDALRPIEAIHLLAHDQFPDAPERATWRFTLRDDVPPHRVLSAQMALHVLELPKAERLSRLPPELAAWVRCLQHSQEEGLMSEIDHEPVREALRALGMLSADDQAQRLAFVRARAVADEEAVIRFHRGEGHEEGHAKGRQEGQAGLLVKQLTARFGPLPEAIGQRLHQASPDELEHWTLKVLDADSLQAVFGSGA